MTVLCNIGDNVLYQGGLLFKEARPILGWSNSDLMGKNIQTKSRILIGATTTVVLFQSVKVETTVS